MEIVTALLDRFLHHLQVLTLISLSVAAVTGFAADNRLQTPVVGCICPGDVLTFTCIANGADISTVWNGSSFPCSAGRITLLPSRFQESVECSSDNIRIVAKGLSAVDNCYTSQLNVTFNSMVNNITVECSIYDSNSGIITSINQSTIFRTKDSPSSPKNFQLTSVTPQMLFFSWNPVPLKECSQLNYTFLTNCSTLSCHNQTVSNTSIFCFNLNPAVEKICLFSVQPVVCGNVYGSISNISVVLQVPQITDIKTVPVYQHSNGELIRLSTIFNQPSSFMIADGVNGSSLAYKIAYTNAAGDQCDSANFGPDSCQGETCSHMIDITSNCREMTSSNLYVTISATNPLGRGPTSAPTTTNMSNQLVDVHYNSTSNTIICRFKIGHVGDKACNITFTKCGESQILKTDEAVQIDELNFRISSVLSHNTGRPLCYTVTARFNVTIVKIEGSIIDDSNYSTAIILSIFFVILTIVLLASPIVVCKLKKQRILIFLLSNSSCRCFRSLIWSRLGVQEVTNRFQLLEDTPHCTLLHLLETMHRLPVARGCAYFEFTRQEDISKHKEIILMDKETGTLYKTMSSDIIERGTNVQAPNSTTYAVFVQSYCGDKERGSNRMISAGERVLYEDPSPSNLGLTLLDRNQFKKWRVHDGTRKLQTLFERRLNVDQYNPRSVFFEFLRDTTITDQDIIFMEKGTKYLYQAGEKALQMFGVRGKPLRPPKLLRWNVFIQNTTRTSLKYNETILIRVADLQNN